LNKRSFLKRRYLHALAKLATAEGFELRSLSVQCLIAEMYARVISSCVQQYSVENSKHWSAISQKNTFFLKIPNVMGIISKCLLHMQIWKIQQIIVFSICWNVMNGS